MIVNTPTGSNSSVQLNTSIANKATTKSYSVTTSDADITLATNATSIELISSPVSAGVVFYKWGFGEAVTASATDFDGVVLRGSLAQVGYTEDATHISIISDSTATLYVVER